MGELLELCSCPWRLCKSWLQKLFNKNNYPLVQIHCIINIMCQELPLGCLNCLFGMCGAKTETFAVVHEFTYFTGMWKKLKFLYSTSIQILDHVLIFQNFLIYRSILFLCIFTDFPVFTDCYYSFFVCLCFKFLLCPVDLGAIE
jgi:hypothetical protein